ncbi:hypothetical protein QUB33_24840 [Microcoleus sp. B3-A4]
MKKLDKINLEQAEYIHQRAETRGLKPPLNQLSSTPSGQAR